MTSAGMVRHTTAGFSLIELMVGIIISIICTLGIMSAFAAFESQKRTTTNGSDAQQNGSFALFEMERQIRTAGSALVQGKIHGVWGCEISAYSAGGTKRLPVATGSLPVPFDTWSAKTRAVPVLIASGGVTGTNPNPDVIAVVRGNPALRTFKSNVVATSGMTVTVDNSFGFLSDEYLLLSDNNGSCTMAQVASVDAGTNVITLATTGSPPDGYVGAYTSTGYLFDLGTDPGISLFGVDPATSSLVTIDLLQRGEAAGAAIATMPIADGIVQMKALYGVDDGVGGVADDGVIDEWVQPTGDWSIASLNPDTDTATAATARARIKAIRIAIVAQSRQPERAAPATAASVASSAFIGYTGSGSLTLFGDLTAVKYTITTSPQYRYRVYDTTIPVRNSLIQRYF